MQNNVRLPHNIHETIADNAIDRKYLHDVTTLAAELKRVLVRYHSVLTEEGVCKEMQTLENWLESERKGPAPTGIISEGGIHWLTTLRDRLKLSADETLRLEGEGGNPCSKEQNEKTDDLMKTICRIDNIITENTLPKPH